jgi:hypothetical protein
MKTAPGAASVSFVNFTVAHGGAFSDEDCGVDGCSYQSCADGSLAAVHLHGAADVALEGVEVTASGQSAVWLEEGCARIALRRCWLHDLGGGGLRVGVPVSGLLPAGANLTRGVLLEDSVIEDGGHICEAGTGILWQTAAEGELRHNEVAAFAYTGISVGWTWSDAATEVAHVSVAHTLVHDIGLHRLSDLAGIYLVGPQRGTRVTNNLIRDVFAGANGAHALYLDQACTGVNASFNVAYRTGSAVAQQHYGLDNVLDNNVFAFPTSQPPSPWPCTFAADCARAGLRSGTHASGEGATSSFAATRNIFLLGAGADEDATLFATDVADGLANMTFVRNVYHATDGRLLAFPPTQAPTSFAQWQAQGKDAGSLLADPLFADAAGGNFTLLPGSPAHSLGIVSIDVSAVGPRGGDPRRRY